MKGKERKGNEYKKKTGGKGIKDEVTPALAKGRRPFHRGSSVYKVCELDARWMRMWISEPQRPICMIG